MLVAGCSHAAGAEIDGTQDSVYNIQNSFGNVLSNMMEFVPINIASSASANPTIARLVLEWFSKNYDPSTMEVFVTVAWTESSSMELPSEQGTDYSSTNKKEDWLSVYDQRYLRINQ